MAAVEQGRLHVGRRSYLAALAGAARHRDDRHQRVGHGLGALGTLTVSRARGCRGVSFGWPRDRPERRTASSSPGKASARPAPAHDHRRRGRFRQTVADLMQLVRQIEIGVDVDGDLAAGPRSSADLLRSAVARRRVRRGLHGGRANRAAPASSTSPEVHARAQR